MSSGTKSNLNNSVSSSLLHPRKDGGNINLLLMDNEILAINCNYRVTAEQVDRVLQNSIY